MKVIKRDGREAGFDEDKITHAVQRCFVNGVGVPQDTALCLANQVSRAVVNILLHNANPVGVEDIQRLVIQQLWALGHFQAAEHYTLYREQRRILREERPVSQELLDLIAQDADHFPTPLQYYQFISKFSRYREADSRRETWKECNDRVFSWFATIPQFSLITNEEVTWLRGMMYDLKSSPAMRVVQMAGPPLERCNVGCYNCAYHPICDLFSFAELLYILMQGSGAGFSVESDYIHDLPKVCRQKGGSPYKYVVEDSTEGWCDALGEGLSQWFDGEDVEYDYSLIRLAGARLMTKGGRAAGPGPLRDLLCFVRTTVLRAQGRRLSDVEVHDICCMIGKIVQVGGVRRASCISLSDLGSIGMRQAKTGQWWLTAPQRSMANNSGVYDVKPPVEVFMEEWLSLLKSRSGERGIFNREGIIQTRPIRRKAVRFGMNPCQPGFATVLTPAGIRTFDDIDTGSVVWSGKSWTRVLRKEATGIKRVFQYNTIGGCFIGTKDHNVFQDGKRITAEFADSIDTCLIPGAPASHSSLSCPIISVDDLGEFEVFDITVEAEEHSYWSGGLLVSNCGEIILRPFQFCNLSISIVRGKENLKELEDMVRAATYFGVVQSCCTNFRYIRKQWKENCEEERLLGVDIMGHLDHPWLRPGAPERRELVNQLKQVVAETSQMLSSRFGINYSAANTCLKPGGDSGVFFNTVSLSPYFSQYQIRRTRESIHSPVCKLLKEAGVPWEPAAEDEASLVAFCWPKKNPEGCITRDSMTAIEQLENWLFWKQTWAEHSCSVTIYVKDSEWPSVGAWCWDHFDDLTGLSFLPWDNGTYRTAPNEAITRDQYEEMVSRFPQINWAKLSRYEKGDETESSQTLACTGGVCET